jgi:hypothetical protein
MVDSRGAQTRTRPATVARSIAHGSGQPEAGRHRDRDGRRGSRGGGHRTAPGRETRDEHLIGTVPGITPSTAKFPLASVRTLSDRSGRGRLLAARQRVRIGVQHVLAVHEDERTLDRPTLGIEDLARDARAGSAERQRDAHRRALGLVEVAQEGGRLAGGARPDTLHALAGADREAAVGGRWRRKAGFGRTQIMPSHTVAPSTASPFASTTWPSTSQPRGG